MSDKLKWQQHNRRPGVWLQVDPDFLSDSHYILVEGALDEAAQWCRDTGCGQRMAYDLWKFKNEKELAVFLLKWS